MDIMNIQENKINLIKFPIFGSKNSPKNPGFLNWNKLTKSVKYKKNHGILCGKLGGVTVVDVDLYKKGKINEMTKAWLGINKKWLDQTKCVQTGNNNFHYYFRYSDIFEGITKNFTEPNIDILNNDSGGGGANCIGEGSKFDGKVYISVNHKKIINMPRELRENIEKLKKYQIPTSIDTIFKEKDTIFKEKINLPDTEKIIEKFNPIRCYHRTYIDAWRCKSVKPGHCCDCIEDQTYVCHDKKTGKIYFQCEDREGCGAQKTIKEATLFDFENDLGDEGYAKYFFKLYKNELVYTGKKEKWYYWDGIMWKNDKEALHVIQKIANAFHTEIVKQLMKQKGIIDEDKFKKIYSKVGKVYEHYSHRENIEKSARHYFYNQDVDWNAPPYLFTFTNGVYDFKTRKFGPSKREDFINDSITCGYEYTELLQKDIDIFENEYLVKVLPEKEKRKIYYKYLGTSLTGIYCKKFLFANGPSNAGKSILCDLQLKMWGKYGYKGNNSMLLGRKTGASPEFANLHMKRAVVFEEPDEDKPFSGSIIKEITGSDSLNARSCYSNNTDTRILGTNFCCCNDKPKINIKRKEDEGAIRNRIIDFPFEATFVSNVAGYEDKKYVFKGSTLYKTTEWQNQHKLHLFHIIKNYVIINIDEDKELLNKELRMRRDKYLDTCNKLVQWFNGQTEEYDGEDWYEMGYYISMKNLWREFKNSEEYRFNRKMYRKASDFKLVIAKKFKKYYRDRVVKNGKNLKNIIIKHQIVREDDIDSDCDFE